MAGHSLSDWYVKELRLSVFLTDTIDPARAHFWESLVGKTPDEIHNKPRQPWVREEGSLLNGRLCVEVRSNRVDWKLLPIPSVDHHGLPFVVGAYDILEQSFRDLMQRWLANPLSLYRLGYGSELLSSAKDMLSAYKKLGDLLPAVDIEPKNTHDFLYRINRRTSSCNVKGLEINRISTWSVIQTTETIVDIFPDGKHIPKVTQLQNPSSICQLDLDINTIPEFNHELDKKAVSRIFHELVDLGNEIAAKGDVL